MKSRVFGALLYFSLGIYFSWSAYNLLLNKYYIEATIIGFSSVMWFLLTIHKIFGKGVIK